MSEEYYASIDAEEKAWDQFVATEHAPLSWNEPRQIAPKPASQPYVYPKLTLPCFFDGTSDKLCGQCWDCREKGR